MKQPFLTVGLATVGGLAGALAGVVVAVLTTPDPPFRPPAAGEDWGALGGLAVLGNMMIALPIGFFLGFVAILLLLYALQDPPERPGKMPQSSRGNDRDPTS